jgi:hypothetical protein
MVLPLVSWRRAAALELELAGRASRCLARPDARRAIESLGQQVIPEVAMGLGPPVDG